MSVQGDVWGGIGDVLGSRDPHIQLLVRVGFSLLVLVLTFAVSRLTRSRFRNGLVRGGLQINVALLLARLLWIAVWVLGFGAILFVLGVGLTPFAALIGVLGLAASLALQQVLQNLVAGVYLLGEQPFKIGDLIAVIGPSGVNHEGTVEDIQMRTTHLRNQHDELILVPNSSIFSGVVTNRTAVGGHIAHTTATFPRTSEPDKVRARLIPLLLDLPGVLSRPTPSLRIDSVGKDDWTATVHFWIAGTEPEAEAATGAVWAIADAFPEATVNAAAETT